MTNSQRLATVRDCLVRWLADQSSQMTTDGSVGMQPNPILGESILIRDGFYCGRRFHLAEHRAVWFLEEDVLKIYSHSGELECVLASEQIGQRGGDDSRARDIIRLPIADGSSNQDRDGTVIRRAA